LHLWVQQALKSRSGGGGLRGGLAPLARRDRASRNLAYALDFRNPDVSIPDVSLGSVEEEEPFWLALEDYVDRSGWRHV